MLNNVEIKQDKCNANVFYQIFKHQQSHLDCNWASLSDIKKLYPLD